MSNTMLPRYSTKKFTDIYDDVNDFMTDYKNIGIPYKINNVQTLTDANAQTGKNNTVNIGKNTNILAKLVAKITSISKNTSIAKTQY